MMEPGLKAVERSLGTEDCCARTNDVVVDAVAAAASRAVMGWMNMVWKLPARGMGCEEMNEIGKLLAAVRLSLFNVCIARSGKGTEENVRNEKDENAKQ